MVKKEKKIVPTKSRIHDGEAIGKKVLNRPPVVVVLGHVDHGKSSLLEAIRDFKITAVKKYREGLPPNEIFRQANFDIKMIGRDAPHECLRRWLKKGETELKSDGRGQSKLGGRTKNIENQMTGLSDREKIKYLETKIAYLKAENDFLAKLRKKSLN